MIAGADADLPTLIWRALVIVGTLFAPACERDKANRVAGAGADADAAEVDAPAVQPLALDAGQTHGGLGIKHVVPAGGGDQQRQCGGEGEHRAAATCRHDKLTTETAIGPPSFVRVIGPAAGLRHDPCLR